MRLVQYLSVSAFLTAIQSSTTQQHTLQTLTSPKNPEFEEKKRCQRRVSPPDPRPEGRESRLFFDFLGRELTFLRNSLQGEGREWEKETPCGKGLGSWDT